jgi:hypothetical protein
MVSVVFSSSLTNANIKVVTEFYGLDSELPSNEIDHRIFSRMSMIHARREIIYTAMIFLFNFATYRNGRVIPRV